MTVEGGASSAGAPADEDVFEKQMSLSNEASAEQLRDSTSPRYVNPQDLDQFHPLDQWMKEKTKRTRMSLVCGDSSMVALHLEAG